MKINETELRKNKHETYYLGLPTYRLSASLGM